MADFAPAPRVFTQGVARLPDPDPDMSPNEVMRHYARNYPDLNTGAVEGPVLAGGEQVFTFKRGIGVKG